LSLTNRINKEAAPLRRGLGLRRSFVLRRGFELRHGLGAA
jgi:hypothetical protein